MSQISKEELMRQIVEQEIKVHNETEKLRSLHNALSDIESKSPFSNPYYRILKQQLEDQKQLRMPFVHHTVQRTYEHIQSALEKENVLVCRYLGSGYHGPTFVITSKTLYYIEYPYSEKKGPEEIHQYNICPIYSFDELELTHLKILCQLFRAPRGSNELIIDLASRYSEQSGFVNQVFYKMFESMIRLIPGSYKNGAWKPLDGFFGLYYNETTHEIYNTPPPL